MPQQTGVVSYGSDIERKKWMREGLVQASSKSFWSSMTGTTMDAVVFQAKNESAADGHTVVFDFTGNLSGRGIRGKETATGKGEQKRVFSSKITVDRYRLVVDNGDEFDATNIGNINLTTHEDSRTKLGDLFVRFKDQALFDAAQGTLSPITPSQVGTVSHVIDLGTTLNYNVLLDIENTLKMGRGFTTGAIRSPLKPYMTSDGRAIWLFMVDSAMATLLKKDVAGYQNIMAQADLRGSDNRLIKGVIGRIGHLYIVEAPSFFGATSGTTRGWGLDSSNIEISGMRQYQGANPNTALWAGQTGFNPAGTNIHSRGLILGAGALQIAFGKQPDYKFQPSPDFAIKSESACEFWMEAQKARLQVESGPEYEQAKIAGQDFGVIAVDVQVSA